MRLSSAKLCMYIRICTYTIQHLNCKYCEQYMIHIKFNYSESMNKREPINMECWIQTTITLLTSLETVEDTATLSMASFTLSTEPVSDAEDNSSIDYISVKFLVEIYKLHKNLSYIVMYNLYMHSGIYSENYAHFKTSIFLLKPISGIEKRDVFKIMH